MDNKVSKQITFISRTALIMNATCAICSNPCFIECGKCFVVISSLGEKHDCPDDDEGFYDMYEGSLLLCHRCTGKMKKVKACLKQHLRQKICSTNSVLGCFVLCNSELQNNFPLFECLLRVETAFSPT